MTSKIENLKSSQSTKSQGFDTKKNSNCLYCNKEFTPSYKQGGRQKFCKSKTGYCQKMYNVKKKKGQIHTINNPKMEHELNKSESENRMLRKQIEMLAKGKKKLLPFTGDNMKIGVLSDTHLGSLYEQPELLKSIIDYFNKSKVDMVIHCGDLVDGEKMYRGHEYEIDIPGCDAQVKHFVKNFPRVKSKMHFITGNHDLSFYKNAGVDIGHLIEQKRDDMVYLGQEHRLLQLGPKFKIVVSHPGGGTAYAVSYRSQKLIESFSGGEKPNLALIGHFHKYDHLFYRNVHCFQVPTTQAQTPFMLRKPTPAIMGGLLLDITVDKKGIAKLRSEYLPYYHE